MTTHRLSVREKIGYSLGDAAANFVFQTMILFQLNFYTDTLGITAAPRELSSSSAGSGMRSSTR